MATTISTDKLSQDVRAQGDRVADEAQSLASRAADQARDAASFVADKAKAGVEAVGAGMGSIGHAVQDHTPQALGDMGHAVADKLESGKHYLEEKGMSGIGDDLTELIRANPVPSLLIGIGLGFCLARLLRS